MNRSLGLLIFIILSLPLQARQPELVTPVPHTSYVKNARYSNSGEFIATASEDHTAKLWNAFTGQLLFTAFHSAEVTDVAFSRNDALLLTISKDSTACIWDLRSRKLLHRLAAHQAPLVSGAFSPDGKTVVTGAREQFAIVWDVATGKPLKRLRVYEYDEYTDLKGAVYALSFSRDGTKLLTGDFDGKCLLWNTRTWDTIRSYRTEGMYVKVARFSEDERFVIAAEWSGFDAYVWKTNDGGLVARFHSDAAFQEYASMSRDNSKLLTALDDTTAALYDLRSGRLLQRFGHTKKIYDAAITADGRQVITGSWDEKVKVWDAMNGKLLQEFSDHTGMIMKICLSPDQRYVATVSTDQTARIFDMESRRLFRNLNYEGYRNKDGSFYLPGNRLVIDHGNAVSVADINKISIGPDQPFSSFKWQMPFTGKYITRQSHVMDKSPLVVFDNQLRPLFTIADARYPHRISNTEKYLVTATADGHTLLYHLPGGGPPDTLLASNEYSIRDIAFSPNDSLLAISRFDGTTHAWELPSAGKVYEQDRPAYKLLINSDNSIMLSIYGNTLYYHTVQGGLLLKKVVVSDTLLSNLALTPDGKHVIVFSSDQKARSYSFLGDTAIQTVETDSYVYGITNHMVFSSKNSNTLAWDISTGVLRDKDRLSYGSHFVHHPQSQLIAFCGPTTVIWDLAAKKIKTVIRVTEDGYETARDARFSPDGTKLVIITYLRTVMYDVATGKLVSRFDDITNQAINCSFKADGSELLISTTGFDYVYQLPGLQLKYSLLTQKNENYLLSVPGGYYAGSPGIVKQLHYVTKGLRTIGFQQLDLQYNRPDTVLQMTGSKDTVLIEAYKAAYRKRVKKLGLDASRFSGETKNVPVAVITNRNKIRYEQAGEYLKIVVSASDGVSRLQKFNTWVNDVPLYGAAGLTLRRTKPGNFDTTVMIRLSEGENRIEVSVTNMQGIESYREPLFVKFIPATTRKNRVHFIGIGINRFKDPAYDLKWSVNDIRKLAAAFSKKYPLLIIDTLLDEAVTKENILALKKKLLQLDVDDKVILSYSGHGVLSKELDYYLSTYDINFNDPEQNGLSYDELESLMDGIKPRKKLMLIDACHSGEIDKEEIERIEASTKKLDSLGTSADTANRSSIVVKKKKLGMANSFELMQSLFVNVSRGTGATIISAAGGMQYAQERGELQGGVFTYSIIEAFNRHPGLTVSQLKKIVGENVIRLTNGLQKPTSRNETSSFDWVVW